MRMWAPHTCPVALTASAACCLRAIGRSTDSTLTDDAQAERLEPDIARGWGVRQQHHVADPQLTQHLRADADLDGPAVWLAVFARLALGILHDRPRHALRWQVANEDDDAAAFAGNLLHRLFNQRAARARAAADAEQIREHLDGLHAHQHRAEGAKIH